MDGEEKKEKKGNLTEKLRENPWILSTFVLVVLAVVVLAGSLGSLSFTGNSISADEAGNIIGGITGYSIDSANEIEGYQINILYQGESVPFFVTKDGKYAAQLSKMDDSTSGTDAGTGSYTGNVEVSEDDDPVLGNADAPVTIIEFSDYQCPYCEKFWSETLPLIKKNYIDTGKARIIYRDFPLSSIHPMAQPAAEAAECVRKISGGSDVAYFKYHDKIFANQASLSESNLKSWAKQMGYSIDSCLDSGEFADEVLGDMQDGSAAGISGTPGFIINGIPVSGAQPYSVFEQIIEGELSG